MQSGFQLYNLANDPLELINLFDIDVNVSSYLSGPLWKNYHKSNNSLPEAASILFGLYLQEEKAKGYHRSQYPKKFWPMLSMINSANFDQKRYWYKKNMKTKSCSIDRPEPRLDDYLENMKVGKDGVKRINHSYCKGLPRRLIGWKKSMTEFREDLQRGSTCKNNISKLLKVYSKLKSAHFSNIV